MDAFEYNGTEEGVPNQPLRAKFPSSNRLPPHWVVWREQKDWLSQTYPNLVLCVRDSRMLPSGTAMPPNMMKMATLWVYAYKTGPMRLSWHHPGMAEHGGTWYTCRDRMCRFSDDLITACTWWNICTLIGTGMKISTRNDKVCMKSLSILPTGGRPFRMSPNNLLLVMFLPECLSILSYKILE